MNCINYKHPEFKYLLDNTKLSSIELEMIISKYQLKNNTLSFPKLNELDTIINTNEVQYNFKVVTAFINNLQQLEKWYYDKQIDKDTFWKKAQTLTQVNKEQLELLKNSKGDTISEKILDFNANYAFTVEVVTAKGTAEFVSADNDLPFDGYTDDGVLKGQPTQVHKNLSVKDNNNSTKYKESEGWSYEELSINTPQIENAIGSGHNPFNSFGGNYIGHVRVWYNKNTGEVDVQELQIYVFQKSRDKANLTEKDYSPEDWFIEEDFGFFNVTDSKTGQPINSFNTREEAQILIDKYRNKPENQFLQLLNKDNAWVTFMTKAIIQDSAKKGYTIIRFPKGDTASKVEGHTTLEEFKKQKEDRIKKLKNEISIDYKSKITKFEQPFGEGVSYSITIKEINSQRNSKQEIEKLIDDYKSGINNEINQLKQELERVETEGFGALRPIYNFYENTITNILNKQGYNPKVVKDEFNNEFNEITLTESHKKPIFFQKDTIEEFKNINTNDFNNLILPSIPSNYELDKNISIELQQFKLNKKEAQTWLDEHLGKDISVNWFRQYVLLGDKVIHGQVVNKSISLGDSALIGTEYHEAFHYVFQYLLAPLYQKEILLEAERIYKTSNITELNELLAEDFKAFVLYKDKKINTLSEKILNFFKTLINHMLFTINNSADINNLFENIYNGRYKNKQAVNNLFNSVDIPIDVTVDTIDYHIKENPNFPQYEKYSAVNYLTKLILELKLKKVKIGNKFVSYENITVEDIINNPGLDLKSRLVKYVIIDAKKQYESYTKSLTNGDDIEVTQTYKDSYEFLLKIAKDLKDNTTNENLYKYAKFNINKLFNTNLIDLEELDDIENNEGAYSKKRSVKKRLFSESEEASFNSNTKTIIALGLEYKYDNNGNVIYNLNEHSKLPQLIDYEVAYTKMQDLLADIHSLKDMKQRLEQLSKFYPNVKQYYDMLYTDILFKDETSRKDAESAFFNNFNKTTSITDFAITQNSNSNGIKKLNTTRTETLFEQILSGLTANKLLETETLDRLNTQRTVLKQQIEHGLAQSFTNATIKNKHSLIANIAALAESYYPMPIGRKYQLQYNSNNVKYNQYLNAFIAYLLDSKDNSDAEFQNKINQLYNYVKQLGEYDNDPTNNKMRNIFKLAKIIDRYTFVKLNLVHKDINGNKRWAVTKHNNISKFISKLKSENEEVVEESLANIFNLLEVNDVKHSNLISPNGAFSIVNMVDSKLYIAQNLNNFEFGIVNGTMFDSNNSATEYAKLDTVQKLLAKQLLYLRNDVTDLNKNKVRTVLPQMGDSEVTYYLSHTRVPITTNTVDINLKTKRITFKNTTNPMYKALYNTVYQDIERIKDATAIMFKDGKLKSEEELDRLPLILNYHYTLNGKKRVYIKDNVLTGRVFKFNNITTFTEEAVLSIVNGNTISDESIKGAIESYVTELFFYNWTIYDKLRGEVEVSPEYSQYKKLFENSGNKYYSDYNVSDKAYEELTLEQQLNSFLTNVEFHLLFAGVNSYQKNNESTVKRSKKSIQYGDTGQTTGIRRNIVVFDKMTTVADVFLEAMEKHLTKAFKDIAIPNDEKAKQVDKIVSSYKKLITSSDGWGIMNIDYWIKDVKARGRWKTISDMFVLLPTGKYKLKTDINPAELYDFIQAMKPIHVETKVVDIEGIKTLVHVFEKLSFFIPTELFSEEGSELDKIYKFLQKNSIDTMVFQSARKDGAMFIEDIFDENNNLNLDNIDLSHVEELKNENLLLQLDVPQDIIDEKIKLAVQLYKHIIGNINDKAEYKIGNITYTGNELKQLHHLLMGGMIKKDHDKLLLELGAFENQNDEIAFTNHVKLYTKMLENGENRNFTTNDLQSIKLIYGMIKSDLSFNRNKASNTAVLNSIITNGIIDTKVAGGALVLLSEAFDNKLKHEKSTELIPYLDKGVWVVPIKMPAWSKSFFKMDENGNYNLIDIKDVDEELLISIGYRVPISDKHSAFVFKVVEFTNPMSGSIIVTPANMILQTGWDFDIDKTFILLKAFKPKGNKIKYVDYKTFTYNDYVSNLINEYAPNIQKCQELLLKKADVISEIIELSKDLEVLLIEKNKLQKNVEIDSNNISNEELEILKAFNNRIKELDILIDLATDDEKIAIYKRLKQQHLASYIEFDNIITILGTDRDVKNAIYDELSDINKERVELFKELKDIKDELVEIILDEGVIENPNIDLSNYIKEDEEYEDALSRWLEDDTINPSAKIDFMDKDKLTNYMYDVWQALLSSDRGFIHMMRQSSTEMNTDMRNELESILNINNNLDPINPEHQVTISTNIGEAKDLLAIAANSGSITTILENAKAYLVNGIAIDVSDKDKEMLNNKFGNVSNNLLYLTNLGWTKDGSNTSMDNVDIVYTVGEDIDQFVDVTSNRLIPNVNLSTYNVQLILKQLGISYNYIYYLINQPIIRRMIALKTSSVTINNSYQMYNAIEVKYYMEAAKLLNIPIAQNDINEDGLISGRMLLTIKNKLAERGFKVITDESSTPIGTTETKLIKNVKTDYNALDNEAKLEHLKSQLEILDFYIKVAKIQSDALAEIRFLNADKLNSNKSFEPYVDLINAVENSKDEYKVAINGKSMLAEIYEGEAYGYMAAYYKYGIKHGYNAIKQLYSTQTHPMRTLIDKFKADFNLTNSKKDYFIINNFESYLNIVSQSKFKLFDITADELKELVGTVENKDSNVILNYINKLQKTNNLIGSLIKPITYNSSKYIYLKVDSEAINSKNINSIHKAFDELFDNDGLDREFVLRLIQYAYFVEGFESNASNITNIITDYVLERIGLTPSSVNGESYTTTMHNELKNNNITFDYNAVVEEFIFKNIGDNKLIPNVNRNRKGFNFKENYKTDTKIKDTFKISNNAFELLPDYIKNSKYIKIIELDAATKNSKAPKFITTVYNAVADELGVSYNRIDISNRIPYSYMPFTNNPIESSFIDDIAYIDNTNNELKHCNL